jgi:mannan polymerase II complex ANP1 subunit
LTDVWRPLPDWLGGEQPYDLNSWQESETALALADTLDEDAVIVEGYAEYATWRPHLAYLRDPYGDPDMEMEIDGVGGVSILAKARVFRYGVHFPAFSFEKHAETEGFGKVSRSGSRLVKIQADSWCADVETHGLLSRGTAALHHLASVRA